MTFTPNLSKKQWIGIATEATPGTLAATPTVYLPTKAEFKNKKKRTYFVEERNTRDVNNAVSDGGRWNEGSLKGTFYTDSSTAVLLAFMGTDTPTQPNAASDPTVWQHALALSDLPSTLSFWKAYHNIVYTMAYNVVEKFDLSWQSGDSDKGVLFDATTKGLPFVKITSGIPSPTYTTVQPLPGWSPTIQINGVASNDIDEVKISASQKWALWYPSNGSPQWTDAYPGDREMSIDFTARFDTDTLYQNFAVATGVDVAMVFTFTGALISGTYNESLVLTVPIVGFDEMDHDDSKENITIKAKCKARPGTAINSLFSAQVINTIASY